MSLNGTEVELTPIEFSLLELLMRFAGQVVTRKMLCEHVWGFNWDGTTNVIEVHINRLRGKIDRGREQSYITTIRGRGYALAASLTLFFRSLRSRLTFWNTWWCCWPWWSR